MPYRIAIRNFDREWLAQTKYRIQMLIEKAGMGLSQKGSIASPPIRSAAGSNIC